MPTIDKDMEDTRLDAEHFRGGDYHREDWIVDQVKQINATPDDLSEILLNADVSAFDIYTQALSNLLAQEQVDLDDSVEQLRLAIENIIIARVDTDEQYHKYCDEQMDLTVDDEDRWSNKLFKLWK